jgi:L-fuconolactonase
MIIDSHQHFWKVERGDYVWMGPHVGALLRDYMPEDLRPHLARAGVDLTIVVQAAETVAETDFLLELAERTAFVAGVVGWLDMDSDNFPLLLQTYRRNPLFVGLRPMLQGLPDDDWILRPRVLEHLRLVAAEGVPFDLLTFTRHLPHVIKALEATPGLKAVVDHISKPEIAAGVTEPWKDLISEVARFPNVYCKLSGMITEANPSSWTLEDLRPYVTHVLSCFGPGRLMFGSDWPVCTLAGTYAEVSNALRALLAPHTGPKEIQGIFGANAARFYGIGTA